MAATAEPSSPTRPAQQTVLTRLHGLFDNSTYNSTTTGASTPSQQPPPMPSNTTLPTARCLKVRILSWNMHDSVPKGDLEELLGSVNQSTSNIPSDSPHFPALPLDSNHPYHLVVVAGQECPSLSGIPMGLGAGFKLKDREKDRDRDKGRDKAKERDRDYDRPPSKLSVREDDSFHESASPAAGWTSLIEDWLCYAGCAGSSPEPGKTRNSSPGPHTPTTDAAAKDNKRRGPYQLLVKDRMMGIYLAIYINRDIRDLVRGTSRSAVTAGLIGGRVGNKGGVGISINLDGTTLLFLNAHLAAHEGKIHHRLQNLAKIKNELTVDDFLSPDNPRMMAEDLTDKFDFTFLCGDLNFRLDISRLHADWLISRQEYAQALEFDQLRNLMRNGQAFVGFQEAPINFPPTFKYDVLRTIKHAKRRNSRMAQWRHSTEKVRLTEVEEKELEDLDDDEIDEEGGEAASMSSTVWTSVHSRPGTEIDDEDEPPSSPLPMAFNKINLTSAANKAKTKWLSILSPVVSPISPHRFNKFKHHRQTPPGSVDITVDPPAKNSLDLQVPPSPLDPKVSSRPSLLSRHSSAKTTASDDEEEDPDKGIYDSSHKKRVPSWCDRILFKSTVEPDPDEEEEDLPSRTRTRVGQFFVNAFRPLSARVRRESYSSSISSGDAVTPANIPSSPTPETLEEVLPFSRFTAAKPALTTSPSNDHLPTTESVVSPIVSDRQNLRNRRSFSALLPSLPHLAPIILPEPTGKGLRPRVRSATSAEAPQTTADSTPSRWRFFPFLSRGDSMNLDRASIAETITPRRRKGDVVCLDYKTLDDKGMRRLEGRSDHRPVIGSFLVYI